MSRRQKTPQLRIKNPAYRQAFERLDIALSKNSSSNDIEKIDTLRRLVFGELPEDKLPENAISQNESANWSG
jgi:hypothetical protein